MYSLFVLLSFIVMKVVNLRLHLSLGTDPVPEPEKEEESEEGSEEESAEKKTKEDKDVSEEATRDGKTAEELKAMEAEMEISVEGQLSSQESQENCEEHLKRHRDSASTLGQSSSLNGTRSQSLELQHITSESGGGSDGAEGAIVRAEMEEVCVWLGRKWEGPGYTTHICTCMCVLLPLRGWWRMRISSLFTPGPLGPTALISEDSTHFLGVNLSTCTLKEKGN